MTFRGIGSSIAVSVGIVIVAELSGDLASQPALVLLTPAALGVRTARLGRSWRSAESIFSFSIVSILAWILFVNELLPTTPIGTALGLALLFLGWLAGYLVSRGMITLGDARSN